MRSGSEGASSAQKRGVEVLAAPVGVLAERDPARDRLRRSPRWDSWRTLAHDSVRSGRVPRGAAGLQRADLRPAGSSATRPVRVYVFNHCQMRRVLQALGDDPDLTSTFNVVELVRQHERAEVIAVLQGDFDELIAALDIAARAPLEPVQEKMGSTDGCPVIWGSSRHGVK